MGVSKAFSKSNMKVCTWPLLSRILAQSFITVGEFHSYATSWMHAVCLTEVYVHQGGS